MKKILTIIAIFAGLILNGQTLINVGSSANDGTGDNLRAAFQKVNANFTEVYDSVSWFTDRYTVALVHVDSLQLSMTGWNKIPLEIRGGYVIDSIRVIMYGATASDIDLTIRSSTSMADTGTVVKYRQTITTVTTPLTIIPANATVTAGKLLWIQPTELTAIPRRLIIEVTGHKN